MSRGSYSNRHLDQESAFKLEILATYLTIGPIKHVYELLDIFSESSKAKRRLQISVTQQNTVINRLSMSYAENMVAFRVCFVAKEIARKGRIPSLTLCYR